MKKRTFITLFILFHVAFIAIKIDKQSRLVRLSYKKQQLEETQQKLLSKKQELVNRLYALKNPATVKKFAEQELKMEPLSLKQIKRIETT